MKPLALFAVVLLPLLASAQVATRPALVLEALSAEKEGDMDQLLSNMSVVAGNLGSILNVLDSPEKASEADVKTAKESLPAAMQLADRYIDKGDVALARGALTRDREKVFVGFPRIDMTEEGSDMATERWAASAQHKILVSQFSLLNLRMASKPSATANESEARYEGWLAEGKKILGEARKQLAAKKRR